MQVIGEVESLNEPARKKIKYPRCEVATIVECLTDIRFPKVDGSERLFQKVNHFNWGFKKQHSQKNHRQWLCTSFMFFFIFCNFKTVEVTAIPQTLVFRQKIDVINYYDIILGRTVINMQTLSGHHV